MTVNLERRINQMCNLSENLIEEGLVTERRRIVEAKLEKGMTINQIAELLELPLEEVQNLAKTLPVLNA